MGSVVGADRREEAPADDALVAAAQRSLTAFEPLYLWYADDIYRFCHRRLASETEAVDAASIVFGRAMAKIATCQPALFRPWLFTIARNVVIDHYRSAKSMQPLDGAYEIEDHAHGPEELAVHNDQMASIRNLRGKLSEDQRSVIELRLSGMSADEIALILGKSRNAIDQAQFRAVARLRALLAASGSPVAETRRS
jgi:RNA polymerase sigma-70 factor (ECF subfamily)